MQLNRTISLPLALFLVMAFAATGLTQRATLTPPRFLPGDDAIGPAAGDQESPAIARGDNSFLVVWSDKRAAAGGSIFSEVETSADIYGMRLDAGGNPIDSVPFAITQGRAAQVKPQVAWNGSNWLVVYESVDVNGTGVYYSSSLEAVRVSPDGQVLDSTPISVHRSSFSSGLISTLASDGDGWVVVNQGTSSGESDIMAMRISPDGIVLDRPARLIVPATYYLRFNLRLAYTSGTFLLVWGANNSIKGVRFNQQLDVLDATPLNLASTSDRAGLAANQDTFYMIWKAQQPDFTHAIKGSRIDISGNLLDGSGVNISGNHQPQAFTAYDTTWDGINFRVSWGSEGVSVARVSPAGVVLDPGGVPLATLMAGTSAGGPSGGLLLAWDVPNFDLAEGADVHVGHVSADNVAGPATTVSLGAPRQTHADIADSGNGSMLVFRSDISGTNRVMAQPLDANGDPVGTGPVLLGTGDSTDGP
ncbi:MAG: hypothetical protein ACK2U9_07450, partial [Anaerolineae bacterium]